MDAVVKFQKIFGLTPDGIVGKATWYRIAYLYTAIARLAELDSEGVKLQDVTGIFPRYLRRGDQGEYVRVLQYYLSAIAAFFPNQPAAKVDGDFGEKTEQAVMAFQRNHNLAPDGIVGPLTWDEINVVYADIAQALPDWAASAEIPLFPRRLVEGMSGDDVSQVQSWLNTLSTVYPEIARLPVTGYFGPLTASSLQTAQSILGLTVSGFVNPITWDTLARQANRILSTQEAT